MVGEQRARGPLPSAEMVGRAANLTRQQRRILEELHAKPTGLTVKEISGSLGLHPNTIRGHMDVLKDLGLVNVISRPSVGPGRPSSVYMAQSALPGRPTAHLAGLVRVAVASMEPEPTAEKARQLGRRWAESLIEYGTLPTGGGVVETTTALMAEMGFAPVTQGATMRLFRCPLIAPDGTIPRVVCEVHSGMIDVVAEHSTDAEGRRLLGVVHPMDAPGSCSVQFTSTAPAATGGETAGGDPAVDEPAAASAAASDGTGPPPSGI
nr:HTH domain-containing protein [Actinomycetales bacterium]